jgi:hypothetical protein
VLIIVFIPDTHVSRSPKLVLAAAAEGEGAATGGREAQGKKLFQNSTSVPK